MPTFSGLIGNRIDTTVQFPGGELKVAYRPQKYTADFEAEMTKLVMEDDLDRSGIRGNARMLSELLIEWDLEWDKNNPDHQEYLDLNGEGGVVPCEEWAIALQPAMLLIIVGRWIMAEMQSGKVSGSLLSTRRSPESSTPRSAGSQNGTSRSTKRRG